MGKRLFDILVAAVLLVLLGPLMLFTALAVRVMLGKPVFFRQMRPGKRGKPFELIKFRTMTDDLGQQLSDEQRLTSFGKWLRRTSLDELPELVNVLRGEMSLVGPRPLLMEYLPLYTDEQARRHEVRPGITGWAQVNGRNAISWDEKFRYDLWYVENQSIWLDIRIILLTLHRLWSAEGVAKHGHATTDRFTGNTQP